MSNGMRRLYAGLGRTSHQVPVDRTRLLYKRSYESYFQLALEEALNKRRFMLVQLNETPAEPWEPEAWHEQEIAIQRRLISTAKIVPHEIAELEIQQMVRSAAASTSRPMTHHW